jgi:ankyrin repeat protein
VPLRDKDGISFLLAASINGHQSTVQFIVLQGGKIEDNDRKRNNIAHYAVVKENQEALNFLSKIHSNLLHVLYFDGEISLLQALRERRNWIPQYVAEESKDNTTALDNPIIKPVRLSKERNLHDRPRYFVCSD